MAQARQKLAEWRTQPQAARKNPDEPPARTMDGRSARRSNRTVQFATRVAPDFDEQIRAIANRDGLLLVEAMQKALAAYEASRLIAAR